MRWHGGASDGRGCSPKYSEAAIQFCLTTTLEIRAIEVTGNGTGDAPMLPCLLDQIADDEPIASVSGDGACDTKGCHEAIARRGAQAVIPTRRNAKPWKDRRPGAEARNAILNRFTRLGTPTTVAMPSFRLGVGILRAKPIYATKPLEIN